MMKAESKRIYSSALRLEAVQAFLDGGLTRREITRRYNIASISTFKKWVIAYRREGEAALQDKPKGRPQGVCNKHLSPVKLVAAEEVFMHYENDRLLRKFGS